MNDQRTATDIIDYIRQHILPNIVDQTTMPTLDALWEFRSHLHALHHYCRQSRFPDDVSHHIDQILSTSSQYYNLISENELTAKDLKDYGRVRTLSAEADGLTNIEELISGEDTLRDVIINSIAFMLNWKSNTIWIDSAKRVRQTLAKNYMLEIQDRIWQFIKESTNRANEMTLEHLNQIRYRVDGFIGLIQAGNPTVEAQIGLLMQIYVLLLRLQLGRLIIRLEEIRDDR